MYNIRNYHIRKTIFNLHFYFEPPLKYFIRNYLVLAIWKSNSGKFFFFGRKFQKLWKSTVPTMWCIYIWSLPVVPTRSYHLGKPINLIVKGKIILFYICLVWDLRSIYFNLKCSNLSIIISKHHFFIRYNWVYTKFIFK